MTATAHLCPRTNLPLPQLLPPICDHSSPSGPGSWSRCSVRADHLRHGCLDLPADRQGDSLRTDRAVRHPAARLLLPFTGSLADRWNRRTMMLLADTGSALTTLVVVLLLGQGSLQSWHIYFLAIIQLDLRGIPGTCLPCLSRHAGPQGQPGTRQRAAAAQPGARNCRLAGHRRPAFCLNRPAGHSNG